MRDIDMIQHDIEDERYWYDTTWYFDWFVDSSAFGVYIAWGKMKTNILF